MLPEYHILSGLENPCRLLVTGGHLLVYYHDGNQKQLHFFFLMIIIERVNYIFGSYSHYISI